MNLLPLCQPRQALQGATAPTRRFERILVRDSLRGQRVQQRKMSQAARASQYGPEMGARDTGPWISE
jgi:hypothetical protein